MKTSEAQKVLFFVIPLLLWIGCNRDSGELAPSKHDSLLKKEKVRLYGLDILEVSFIRKTVTSPSTDIVVKNLTDRPVSALELVIESCDISSIDYGGCKHAFSVKLPQEQLLAEGAAITLNYPIDYFFESTNHVYVKSFEDGRPQSPSHSLAPGVYLFSQAAFTYRGAAVSSYGEARCFLQPDGTVTVRLKKYDNEGTSNAFLNIRGKILPDDTFSGFLETMGSTPPASLTGNVNGTRISLDPGDPGNTLISLEIDLK